MTVRSFEELKNLVRERQEEVRKAAEGKGIFPQSGAPICAEHVVDRLLASGEIDINLALEWCRTAELAPFSVIGAPTDTVERVKYTLGAVVGQEERDAYRARKQ